MGLPQNTDLFIVNVGGTQGEPGSGQHFSVTWAEMLTGTEAHLQNNFDSKVDASLLGVAEGVATLNNLGIIPEAQLPTHTVGGYEFEITTPQENDVLQLKSSKWRNTPQDNLVDGGNF